MAYKEKGKGAFSEGFSLDVPPLLDPTMFIFWKKRFEAFVKSKSLRLWEIIEFGDYIPRTAPLAPYIDGYILEKSEWSEEDKIKVGDNYLAIHLLYCAIPDKEFGTIIDCGTAHDIWKSLVMIHEDNA